MEKAALRIACLEDEQEQTYYLKTVLEAWQKERGTGCSLACFSSAEAFWFEHGRNGPFPYDLLILDIYMGPEAGKDGREGSGAGGRMNGMELARAVRRTDRDIAVVFLSNLKEYVFQGYEVNAVRYLVKPVTKEGLFPVLDLLLCGREEKPACTVLSIGGEYRKIPLKQILYLEAVGHYVRLYQASGELLEWKQPFSAVLGELAGDCFVKIHRSFCVNLMHVNSITRKCCLLDDGTELPLSRSAWQEANEAFLRYSGRREF